MSEDYIEREIPPLRTPEIIVNRAEHEALLADKARLDWLEHYLSNPAKGLGGPTPGDPSWQFGFNGGPCYVIDGQGDTLREAIDNAREPAV